ncbi:MAG: hypothetical protein A2Z34_09610 [Planctomycetes bacterium RBG_16_59_8]|nr:MAG: hypothetical protein A2Z34_09610 [Planctomycetes bacterium RBG_16_59_8]
MAGPRNFYDELWKVKNSSSPAAGRGKRDWFHRWFLDWLIDPGAHTRHELAARMLPSSGGSLLDIGCGNGESLALMGVPGKFTKVCGVDISGEAIAAARAKGIDAAVIDLNGASLPFESGSFDCVTILAVLEHLFDPHHVLREIRRVLKEGGTLVINVPNAASFSNRLRILFGRAPVTSYDPGWDGGHLHYFTPRDLKKALREHGFTVVGRGASGGGQWIRMLFLSLSGEFLFRCVKRSDSSAGASRHCG